jgi:chromosome segregation ATPase
MYKQLQKKDKEIARLSNNSEYYESLLDSSRKENRTLQLTISDLNTSRDSIVQ